MKFLADTHIILWYLNGDEQLSEKARKIIDNEENEIFFSLVSMWEIEIKHITHSDIMKNSGYEVFEKCQKYGFSILPIEAEHIKTLGTLCYPDDKQRHNDPFDRMLLAQAKTENINFITHDSLIPNYNESCIISV